MRGLTLTQPWASLVAIGAKRIETRSWSGSYRGPVAIHAAKGFPRWAKDLVTEEPFAGALFRPDTALADLPYDNYQLANDRGTVVLPLGAIVAVADLVTYLPFTERTGAWLRERTADGRLPTHEADFGDFAPGRYGFLLAGVRALPEPIPCRGALGLWEVPADVLERLEMPA